MKNLRHPLILTPEQVQTELTAARLVGTLDALVALRVGSPDKIPLGWFMASAGFSDRDGKILIEQHLFGAFRTPGNHGRWCVRADDVLSLQRSGIIVLSKARLIHLTETGRIWIRDYRKRKRKEWLASPDYKRAQRIRAAAYRRGNYNRRRRVTRASNR